MADNHYDYVNGAKLGYHSAIKHKILRDYIKEYIATLTHNVGIDRFKIAIVDGFAGGGTFKADWTPNTTVYGSPITILEACEEARNNAQLLRRKPFILDAKYYFVEKTRAGYQSLIETLNERGYKDRVNNEQDIIAFNAGFEAKVIPIVEGIKNRSPASRSIFLLDQYGYTDVPKSQIRYIFNELPGAEILLTFNVDSLLQYLNEKNLRSFSKTTGFSIDHLLDSGLHDKESRPQDWRLAAQAILHKSLIDDCFPNGDGHHTTFYIRAINGYGDYWLVHLSRNLTARNVMVDIHWLHGNHFVHYGGAGFDMYCLNGFNTHAVADLYGFGEDAKLLTMKALDYQLPKLVRDHHLNGISFKDLQIQQANYTPARGEDIRLAFRSGDLRQDLIVVTADGKRRRNHVIPQDSDIILPNPNGKFF